MASTDEVLHLARAVLVDRRFDAQLAAVVRHAGWEDRRVDQLSDDEREGVIEVLGRISGGSHYPHLKLDGTYDIRRHVTKPPAQSKSRAGSKARAQRGRRIGRAS